MLPFAYQPKVDALYANKIKKDVLSRIIANVVLLVNNNVFLIDLPAMTEIDLSRLAVLGLTLPSRCPCCPGGARKTQSLVAPTLELQIENVLSIYH